MKAMITSSQVGADSPSSGRSMEIVMFSSLIDSNICIVFLFGQNYAVLSRNYAPVLMSLNMKGCQNNLALCEVSFFVSYLGPCSDYLWSMVTYYCISMEEALRRAKTAGKQPGCYYGGITLRSGKKEFAVYKKGRVIKKHSVFSKPIKTLNVLLKYA